MQWDLYRDLRNANFAQQIVKINNSLKIFPNSKISDDKAISLMRQMKQVSKNLKAKETLIEIDLSAKIQAAKKDEEKKKIAQQIELEKMRETRAEVLIIKVQKNIEALTSSDWSTRRSAVWSLQDIIGGDITTALFIRLAYENNSDVIRALNSVLSSRLAKKSLYLLKNESLDALYSALLKQAAGDGLRNDGTWIARAAMAKVLRFIPNVETYKILAERKKIEKDSDVLAAINNSLSLLESDLVK